MLTPMIIGWKQSAPTLRIRAPTNEVGWFAIGDGSVYLERPYKKAKRVIDAYQLSMYSVYIDLLPIRAAIFKMAAIYH